jgi:hypothetical protein
MSEEVNTMARPEPASGRLSMALVELLGKAKLEEDRTYPALVDRQRLWVVGGEWCLLSNSTGER